MNDRLQYIINCREGAGVGTLLFKSKLIVFWNPNPSLPKSTEGRDREYEKEHPRGHFCV